MNLRTLAKQTIPHFRSHFSPGPLPNCLRRTKNPKGTNEHEQRRPNMKSNYSTNGFKVFNEWIRAKF